MQDCCAANWPAQMLADNWLALKVQQTQLASKGIVLHQTLGCSAELEQAEHAWDTVRVEPEMTKLVY